jgi:hypothetical protein
MLLKAQCNDLCHSWRCPSDYFDFSLSGGKRKAKVRERQRKWQAIFLASSHAQLAVSYPEKLIEYLAYLVTFCLVGRR